MQFETLVDVLEFAIQKEEEAEQLYTNLAKKMTQVHMAKIFEEFAAEERSHKRKIKDVIMGRPAFIPQPRVVDLRIGDHLVAPVPSPDMDYQHALIMAMKAEKAAYALYTQLSEASEEEGMRDLFQLLAQEEAKHKLRFELEYDEQFSGEN